MGRGLVPFVIVISAALAGPGRAQDQALLAACDDAAASPADANRPAGVSGVPLWKINPDVAVPACEAAVKAVPDNARIIFQLGRAYRSAKSHQAAVAQYTKEDELGYAPATYNLSGHYKGGLGVAADISRGKALLEKATNAGVIASMQLEWETAAASGDADAMLALGIVYAQDWGFPKDYAIARGWYEKAAARGNTAAMLKLGYYYSSGLGGRPDFNVARDWHEKAAANSDVNTVSRIGMAYAHGAGVPVDHAFARRLWEQAAAGGSAEAMANLGWMYSLGRDVAQDYAVARDWFEKAVVGGNAAAMNNLGQFYDYGCGVAEDRDEARRWYEKAKAHANSDPQTARFADRNLMLLNQPAQHRARMMAARTLGCGAGAPPIYQWPLSPLSP